MLYFCGSFNRVAIGTSINWSFRNWKNCWKIRISEKLSKRWKQLAKVALNCRTLSDQNQLQSDLKRETRIGSSQIQINSTDFLINCSSSHCCDWKPKQVGLLSFRFINQVTNFSVFTLRVARNSSSIKSTVRIYCFCFLLATLISWSRCMVSRFVNFRNSRFLWWNAG